MMCPPCFLTLLARVFCFHSRDSAPLLALGTWGGRGEAGFLSLQGGSFIQSPFQGWRKPSWKAVHPHAMALDAWIFADQLSALSPLQASPSCVQGQGDPGPLAVQTSGSFPDALQLQRCRPPPQVTITCQGNSDRPRRPKSGRLSTISLESSEKEVAVPRKRSHWQGQTEGPLDLGRGHGLPLPRPGRQPSLSDQLSGNADKVWNPEHLGTRPGAGPPPTPHPRPCAPPPPHPALATGTRVPNGSPKPWQGSHPSGGTYPRALRL